MTPVIVKTIVFWIVTPCSLENIHLPFVGNYLLPGLQSTMANSSAVTVKKAAPFCTFLRTFFKFPPD